MNKTSEIKFFVTLMKKKCLKKLSGKQPMPALMAKKNAVQL